MVPSVNQGNASRGLTPDHASGMPSRNYTMPPASYVGSAYQAVPGLQYPITYTGGLMSTRPLSGSAGSVSPTTVNTAASSSVSSGGQVEGSIFLCPVLFI